MGSPDLQWSLMNWIRTWPNIFQLQTQDSGQISGTWIFVFCCLFSIHLFRQHGTTLSTVLNTLILKLIFPSTHQTGGWMGHGASLVAVAKRNYVVPAGNWTQFQVIQPLGVYSWISIFKFCTQNTAHAQTQYLNNWSRLKIILNLACHCMLGLVCVNAVLFMSSYMQCRLLEEGNLSAAETLKLQLEQTQRDRRKHKEQEGIQHEPRWFRYVWKNNITYANITSFVFLGKKGPHWNECVVHIPP